MKIRRHKGFISRLTDSNTIIMTKSVKVNNRFSRSAMWLVHIAALVCVSIWGLSFVSTKVLLNCGMGPVEIYMYRFIIAYILVLFFSHKRLFAYNWREEGMFAICGICAGSIYFIAENTALKYTLATNVSLLTSLSPLITAFLAGFIYRNERPGRGVLIGSAIAFLGVACVIFNASATLEVRPLGDILSIGAAFSWALYSLVLRRVSANYDVWFITRKTFFYGVISAIPFLLMEPSLKNPLSFLHNTDVIINVLFLAVGASLVGYLLWSLAVKKMGAVKANNYMYFQSVMTMIASAIIIGEPITTVGVIGCAMIIGGLYLGDRLNSSRSMQQQKR